MADDRQQDERPLRAEAEKRGEWRGGATIVQEEDVSGHTSPASESGAAGDEESHGAPAAPTTIPPPD
ncbi:MAG TPA: hypothetical protein VF662_14450 [Allosphingosinicella sp.]|jgi:hypothetical protein